MATADKNVVGLLNGLARRNFYGESDITDEFLHQELFPDFSAEQFAALLKKFDALARNLASADMDFNQLEAFLTSQIRKKEGGLTEEQAAAVMKFWKSHKSKIHDVVVQKSCWNNRLKNLSWRVDVKTQARHMQQLNTPVAIVEMQIENRHSQNPVSTLPPPPPLPRGGGGGGGESHMKRSGMLVVPLGVKILSSGTVQGAKNRSVKF